MKLTLDNGARTHRMRSFAPGEVRIGEQIVTTSCLVTADRIMDWPPRTLSELEPGHLDAVLALAPEIVLLGSGTRQRFPAQPLMARVLARGIGFEVMDTAAACRTFNILVAEDRRVVAALLLNDD